MLGGIVIGLAVSAIWIGGQIVLARILGVSSYFRAMLTGYIFSLPIVYLLWRYLPGASWTAWTALAGVEHPDHALLHAYVAHLLVFFLYVECFYHVERSVTLRLLIEILGHSNSNPTVEEITRNYKVTDMIAERLAALVENNYLEKSGNRFRLLAKGRWFATGVRLFCWIYQSKTQDERLSG